MKVHVLIAGERHPVSPEPGAPHLELDRRCPACGGPSEGPLRLIAERARQAQVHDTITAPALALCCGAKIGSVVVEVETIFGLEEDDAVLEGRARVYG